MKVFPSMCEGCLHPDCPRRVANQLDCAQHLNRWRAERLLTHLLRRLWRGHDGPDAADPAT